MAAVSYYMYYSASALLIVSMCAASALPAVAAPDREEQQAVQGQAVQGPGQEGEGTTTSSRAPALRWAATTEGASSAWGSWSEASKRTLLSSRKTRSRRLMGGCSSCSEWSEGDGCCDMGCYAAHPGCCDNDWLQWSATTQPVEIMQNTFVDRARCNCTATARILILAQCSAIS